jgi:hypothetical protein
MSVSRLRILFLLAAASLAAPAVAAAADAINLSQAVIEGESPLDVASRPATAGITAVDIGPGGVRIDFTRKEGDGRWPSTCVWCSPVGSASGDIDGALQYTLWLAMKSDDGLWHAAGIIEYWYGLDRSGGDITVNNQIPVNWTYYIPAMRRQPAVGEIVGFFVTAGDQRRKDIAAVRERSNVVLIPFPGPGGNVFAFAPEAPAPRFVFPTRGPITSTRLSRAEVVDLDNDRRTDMGLFRPGNGTWYGLSSVTNFASGSAMGWGASGDVPVPGDYDGDSKTDIAVFRPSNGVWYILFSSSRYATGINVPWGAAGDIPAPGDYDGDGKTDIALFRRSTGTWYFRLSSSGFALSVAGQWGTNTDIPVPGDYDGDGVTDIGVFRPSTGFWYLLTSSSNFQSAITGQWGTLGDVPVPGDYDGDGKTDVAVWRGGTNGTWYIVNSSNSAVQVRQWGAGFAPYWDLPVPGDYDGDGKTDLAVWRSSTGNWYVILSSTGALLSRQWGAGYAPYNDIPANASSVTWLLAYRP